MTINRKQYCMICCILSMLLLCGCELELVSPDSLITAPVSNQEKLQQKQLITSFLSRDESLIVPEDLDNSDAYQYMDVDQDGTDEIIAFCAQSRAFMPHFHIPLQSGSDEVLRLMHRRYDTALFRHKIERIKELMPDAFIGVDVIVGTRGETEELFDETLHFLRSLPVTQLHVFSYSERPGTMALKIPHVVSAEEKHRRSNLLLQLSEEKLHTYYNIYRDSKAIRPVLLEHSRTKGAMHGYTDNYIRVELRVSPDLMDSLDNTTVRVQLGDWNAKGDALMGELIR